MQGFDASYGARFPFTGRNGTQLDSKFAEAPTSYMAIANTGFPVSILSFFHLPAGQLC